MGHAVTGRRPVTGQIRLWARSLGKARLSAELEADDATAEQHLRKVGCLQDSESEIHRASRGPLAGACDG